MSSDDLGNRDQILDDTSLAVDQPNRHQRGIGINLQSKVVEINEAEMVDTDNLSAQLFDGEQDRMVFHGGTRDRPATRSLNAENGQVVGLGPACGEDDVARSTPDGLSQHVTGVVEVTPSLAGHLVRARRVGVTIGEHRHHGSDGLGAHRC